MAGRGLRWGLWESDPEIAVGEVIVQRVLLKEPPFPELASGRKTPPWEAVSEWPARWLSFPETCGFVLFRLQLNLTKPLSARIHVTADERYELYIDGRLHDRGPERGDPANWYFETFSLVLPAGRHTLLARVWALGADAPWAQMSVRPGFLLAAEAEANETLSTGVAKWDMLPLRGIGWTKASEQTGQMLGGGPGFNFDCAKLQPQWRDADSGPWVRAESGEMPAVAGTSVFIHPNRHFLTPATLRPQLRVPCKSAALRYCGKEDVFANPLRPIDENANDRQLQYAMATVLKGEAFTVPPRTHLRAVIDLGRYSCHYPSIRFSGGKGAEIRLRYAESLWDKPDSKSMEARDRLNGRVFRGLFDTMKADGESHTVDMPWWRAGRFVQVEIRTTREPLTIEGISFQETGYELGQEFKLESNIPGVQSIAAVALRTLQMCSHETHMDCPYYEQLQYVGDTRLQALLSFLVSSDARLARKAILMFDASRANASGLTLDSYPGAGKLIPSFALWWIAMINDYARWRGDAPMIRPLLPGAREVIERFASLVDEQGLLTSPRGWNYVDVAQGFEYGVPPGGVQGGRSGVLQFQLIYTLVQLAELEDGYGEASFAGHWRELAGKLLNAAEKHYWDKGRQLFADDLDHKSFSQHTQVLAVLSRMLKRIRAGQIMNRVVRDKDLIQCNIYFLHYLFEATSLYDGGEYLRSRLGDWQRLIDKGFTTFPEHFGATRSECHAWSAHVLYHILTVLVGVKAIGAGMERVRIEPALRKGERMRVSFAHPKGMLHLDVHQEDELEGTLVAPRGVAVEGPLGNVKLRLT